MWQQELPIFHFQSIFDQSYGDESDDEHFLSCVLSLVLSDARIHCDTAVPSLRAEDADDHAQPFQ